jgi:isoleucyl-tRNA synthetase
MSFQPVSSQVDFVTLEQEMLAWWANERIVEKYLAKNSSSNTQFSFLDGPITANNPMGVHHAWGRTYKDLFQRFHTMLGDKQRYQNGFDEQGLWVEVEVEKELGLKNKKDILNLVPGDEFASLEKFINLCKERVAKYSAIQAEQSQRLGYFMDWAHSYHTSSSQNNYEIWHFLKVCQDKGWIYKGNDSVPWCPRCGTAISQMEILTEDYKTVGHESVYVKLPINNRPGQYLLVWTTTPWTVPANVAVAVNADETYVAYQVGKEFLWVMEKAVPRLKTQGVLPASDVAVNDTLQGSMMVGWEYSAPYDDLSVTKDAFDNYVHRVIDGSEVVTDSEGTGLLHVAPGAGQEDYRLGKVNKLPILSVIDEGANYVEGLDRFAGKNAKVHPEVILDDLKGIDGGRFFFKTEKYTHRYPICWRCKTELVWRVVDEWYIAVDRPDASGKTYREQMVETAKAINWIPDFGLPRELDWLKNMSDWLISKKRFWGLALPIYEDTDGSFMVVGSLAELKELAVEGMEFLEGTTPHRPWIDKIKIRSPKTGAVLSRIPDVGNPWLDAGIVPFSTMSEDWFPADFITESFPGQFKNWFYAMIAMTTALKEERQDTQPFRPFKTVLGYNTVRDEKGEEMHKSKGNSIPFDEAATKIGAESMRWQFVTANPENHVHFGYGPAKDIQRRFFLIWWNVYNFFVTYALLDKWEPIKEWEFTDQFAQDATYLDKWILLKLYDLVAESTLSLQAFDAMTPSRHLEQFVVQDLSTWYIRRSRERVGPTATDDADKHAFYQTTYVILVTLCQLAAPYAPFLTDAMYRNLMDGTSVHLSDWPEVIKTNDGEAKNMMLEEMRQARLVVERGHRRREALNLKLKLPLLSAVYGPSLHDGDFHPEIVALIKAELNVKDLRFSKSQEDVDFDTSVTPELEAERQAREIIRSIQSERKKLGCSLDARVIVTLPEWPVSLEDEIRRQTLADKLISGSTIKVDLAPGAGA